MSLVTAISDEDFINIVLNSTSIKEVGQKLGYNSHSGRQSNMIKKRCEELGLDLSHFEALQKAKRSIVRTEENVFCLNSTADQKTLRRYFYNLTKDNYMCSICGQEPIWQNKPLTLILDHIDGHNKNNVLSNLRWVCPNCNIQLDTTSGKHNKKKDG